MLMVSEREHLTIMVNGNKTIGPPVRDSSDGLSVENMEGKIFNTEMHSS